MRLQIESCREADLHKQGVVDYMEFLAACALGEGLCP